jgi:SNF2 family DNA or RNA helicase
LRNVNSRWRGATKLRATIRWLISGTPVQNKRNDFFNLCAVLRLPKAYYSDDLNLPHLVKHFVLKRSKAEVGILLPPITVDHQMVSWKHPTERNLSERIHQALSDGGRGRLRMMMHARQVCTLPSLLRSRIQAMVQRHIIPPLDNEQQKVLDSSSKVDAVVDLILARRNNHAGKLIFCHFRHEIDTILARLALGGLSRVCVFDGRLPQNRRFSQLHLHYDAILLQIQTGCEGLNLQADFSEIYFVTPDWNPAVEDQAVARCHRFGQTRPVSVFHFQMESFQTEHHSLDHRVAFMQQNKRLIAETIFMKAPAI